MVRSVLIRLVRRLGTRAGVWVLAGLALCLRLGVGLLRGEFDLPPIPWEHGYEIGGVAAALVDGEGFANPYLTPTGPTANVGPVLPGLLASFFLVFGKHSAGSWIAYQLLHVSASSLVVPALHRLGRIAGGPVVGVLAAVAWAVHPVAVLGAMPAGLDHNSGKCCRG